MTDRPKYTNLEPDEKIVKSYTDNSAWMTKKMGLISERHGVGYFVLGGGASPGSIFITNKRIIYENLNNSDTLLSINHKDINRTEGRNNTAVTCGELKIYYEDGSMDKGLSLPSGKELSAYLNSTFYTEEEKIRRTIEAAENKEKHLDYHGTIELYESIGNDKEAARVRRLMYDEKKVDQTVVHGDYVDDRDTIIKDSVISKSNVGAGGDDKFARLEKLTEMKKEGLIDDNEFKQMKKEILGK